MLQSVALRTHYTSRAGTSNPSRAPEFILVYCRVHLAQSLFFVYCYLLVIVLPVFLWFMASSCPLVSLNFFNCRSRWKEMIKETTTTIPVPEMDGRPVAKYLIRATKSCSKLGSHWPNKKRLGDCLKDRKNCCFTETGHILL